MTVNQKLTRTITARVVAQARQEDVDLQLMFTDGSVLHIKLQDPSSSVMIRNASGELEYAD
jgi:hypothetical protein